MNRRVLSLAVLVGALLVGCGGTVEAPEVVEPAGAVSQELSTCTATCGYGASVSCTGSTCSATNNSGVTCDGNTTPCPPPPEPPETCDGLSDCTGMHGMSCSPNRSVGYCCIEYTWVGSCFCSQGTWTCPL